MTKEPVLSDQSLSHLPGLPGYFSCLEHLPYRNPPELFAFIHPDDSARGGMSCRPPLGHRVLDPYLAFFQCLLEAPLRTPGLVIRLGPVDFTNHAFSKEITHRNPPDHRIPVLQLLGAYQTGMAHSEHLHSLQRLIPDQFRTREPREIHRPLRLFVHMRHFLWSSFLFGTTYQFKHGIWVSLRPVREQDLASN